MGHHDTRRIGRVAAVESERVEIELDPTAPGLVKAGTGGVVPIGGINSYVTFPGGAHRLVAVITAVHIGPSRVPGKEDYAAEAAVERTLSATIVGRFESGVFEPGISTYPSLFAPVSVATSLETEALFRPSGKYSITLGEAVVAPGQDVRLDPDRLLAHHAAVLGSTGSGKSCTVTALIDAVLELGTPGANIIVFDTNGEYAAAFAGESERRGTADACLIGGVLQDRHVPLVVPGWFMDNSDHVAFFQASEGAQQPLLQRAIADARHSSTETIGHVARMRNLRRSLTDIDSIGGRKPQEVTSRHLKSIEAGIADYCAEAAGGDPQELAFWEAVSEEIRKHTSLDLDDNAWDQPLTLKQREGVQKILKSIDAAIASELDRLGLGTRAALADFDAPRHYDLSELVYHHLPTRIELEATNEPRIRNYAATLVMRMSRLLADARYDFVTRVDYFDNALAQFLRLVLGHEPLTGCGAVEPPWAPEYRREVGMPRHHSVTVVDLSGVASDVLETITALLARILLDFAQKVEPRGRFPMWLILEEAHRYVPAVRGEQSSRSTAAFERIAKEGRKFGVSLLLASQRPSELSRTVLAQCGTLIAHRVVNAEDQDLIRSATALAGREVLRQLPGLAPQHAIVIGEAVPAPTYVRIRDVPDPPRSRNPAFIDAWSAPAGPADGRVIDSVAHTWAQGDG